VHDLAKIICVLIASHSEYEYVTPGTHNF